MKLIHFFSHKKNLDLGQPSPAKGYIPEWYRAAESTYLESNGQEAAGLKKCAPYLDAMVSGYVVTTPVDIFVTEEIVEGEAEPQLKMSWNGPPSLDQFVKERPQDLGKTMPRPVGHHPNHLVWAGYWGMKTPRGWSLLVTHPLNRDDLPFRTTSGIIDSDEFYASGNIPFFMQKGFTGVIPEGTPIAQIIPIKRASWKMIPNNQGLVDFDVIHGKLARNPETLYKKSMWHRKEYN
jgi:hypothetical protein